MSQGRTLHWQPTGLFPLAAAGPWHYNDEIAELAQNPKGKNALVFCTATLVPEDTNPNDSNAVMVQIEGKKVGYLPRDYAKTFRGYFKKFRIPAQITTCDAVISAGLEADYGAYDYTIELDIAQEPTAPTAVAPTYPMLDRRDPTPVLRKQDDGGYLAEVRLAHGVLEDMHRYKSVHSWTADHWSTINYYLLNRQGIGLGHKLFEIPKEVHAEMFGDKEPDAAIESLVGRTALVSLKPAP